MVLIMGRCKIVFYQQAPAKINLMLHVTGRDATGFHELQSLFALVDLADRLAMQEALESTMEISGPFAAIVDPHHNSVLKAISWFYQYTAIPSQDWRISLEKNIPVAAGLGGGTSDAAAALKILSILHNWQPTNVIDFIRDSGKLGADVPVCLAYQWGLGHFFWLEGSGRKQYPQPLTIQCPYSVLLVNPNIPCPTGRVFQTRRGQYSESIAANIPQDYPLSWLALRCNDLQPAACQIVPQISEVLAVLEKQLGCRLARMSGSGATCFALFDNFRHMKRSQQNIQKHYPQWWVAGAKFI